MMRMKRALVGAAVCIGVLISGSQARADVVAYTCKTKQTTNGSITALRHAGACVGYVVKDRNGRVRQRGQLGFRGSGTLSLAPDGKTVVFVHNSPWARVNRVTGAYEAFGMRVRGQAPVLFGVALYRDGKLFTQHLLSDLVHRPRMVAATKSHFRWLLSAPRISRRHVTLRTTSFRHAVIDLRTGALTARDTAQWTSCHAMAYGGIKAIGLGVYRMKPAHQAKGKPGKTLRFTTIPGLKLPNGYRTVCLRRNKGKWQVSAAHAYPRLNGLVR